MYINALQSLQISQKTYLKGKFQSYDLGDRFINMYLVTIMQPTLQRASLYSIHEEFILGLIGVLYLSNACKPEFDRKCDMCGGGVPPHTTLHQELSWSLTEMGSIYYIIHLFAKYSTHPATYYIDLIILKEIDFIPRAPDYHESNVIVVRKNALIHLIYDLLIPLKHPLL